MALDIVPNFRDFGGHRLPEGKKVRTGVVFRSAQVSGLSAVGVESLRELGVRHLFDLRTNAERTSTPDQDIAQVTVVPLDVLADADHSAAGGLTALLANPAEVRMSVDQAEAALEASYRDFVSLPSARESYRSLYQRLADDDTGPALVHCTAGKDRTGWAIAALLTWLGVDAEAVLTDYLLSNEAVLAHADQLIGWYVSVGGDEQVLRALLAVRSEYLAAGFAEVERLHGDLDTYFRQGLSLDAGTLTALSGRLATY